MSNRHTICTLFLTAVLLFTSCGGGGEGDQGFYPTSTNYCVKGGLPRLPGYVTISDTQTEGEYTFRATQGIGEYAGNVTINGNTYTMEGTDDSGSHGLTVTMQVTDGSTGISGTWQTWDMYSGSRTVNGTYTISGDQGSCPTLYADTWDVDTDGIPRFADSNYIDLSKIDRISKFRSSIGHDYSDSFESCRSMKHYFEPDTALDWSTVEIYSPFDGEVVWLLEEWVGHKIVLKSSDYPAFYAETFHVVFDSPVKIGDTFTAGQRIGTHGSNSTMSDIAVSLMTPDDERKLISFFDVMTNTVFQEYQLRGMNARNDAVISKTDRDNDPNTCSNESFVTTGSLDNWVTLN